MSLWSLAAVFLLVSPAVWTRTMETFELRMPGIIPTQADAHLCHSFTIPSDETRYITSIAPILVDPEAIHHIQCTLSPRSLSCPSVDSERLVWSCGGQGDEAFPDDTLCGELTTGYLYDWTKNVPEYHLPTGVGFQAGGKRDYQMLVVEVHYSDVSRFNESFRDTTGVKVAFTRERPPKLAALASFHADGLVPPGHRVSLESQCVVRLPEDTTLRVCSYVVHTHDLGLLVTDYRVRDGVWTEIGQRSTQLPQELAPTDVSLHNGDIMVLRCLMFNKRNHAVSTGHTSHDEMCRIRLLVYTEDGEFTPTFECDEIDPPDFATMTSRFNMR